MSFSLVKMIIGTIGLLLSSIFIIITIKTPIEKRKKFLGKNQKFKREKSNKTTNLKAINKNKNITEKYEDTELLNENEEEFATNTELLEENEKNLEGDEDNTELLEEI